MRPVPLFALLLLLTACDTGETNESTYPPPGNYPALPLAEAFSAEAGQYNIEAYVGSIQECPENTECLVPDHFTAVDAAPPTPPTFSLTVFAEEPSQLDIGQYYLFSIELTGPPSSNRTATLLGYAEAERLE